VLTDEKSGEIIFGPFSIQPIILLIFVLTFLLLEWLLSENAVVGNLFGRFWSIPRQNSSSLPRGMYKYSRVPSQLPVVSAR